MPGVNRGYYGQDEEDDVLRGAGPSNYGGLNPTAQDRMAGDIMPIGVSGSVSEYGGLNPNPTGTFHRMQDPGFAAMATPEQRSAMPPPINRVTPEMPANDFRASPLAYGGLNGRGSAPLPAGGAPGVTGQQRAAQVRQNPATAGASGGSMGPLAYLAPIAAQAMDRSRQEGEAKRQQRHNIYAGLAQSQGAPGYGMQAAAYQNQNRDIEGRDYLSELLPLLQRRRGGRG